jgi:NO-binding membrane sensor protein with MHYT domain
MEYGTYVPFIAYLVSCLGCGLGLVCTNQARGGAPASRNRWLILAAISIGGTGIWGMHFTGMLGVTVYGSPVKWDVVLTLVSLLIAVVMVGIGVFVVSYGPSGMPMLLLAGLVTGCGVAAMHYMGMAAMHVQGSIEYNIPLVALSVAIGVAAATVALWITKNVRRKLAMAVAIPIMGLAVCGMHYTGMAATSLALSARAPIPVGVHQALFFWPLVIWIMACPIIVLSMVALAPSAEEILQERRYQEIAARLQDKQ